MSARILRMVIGVALWGCGDDPVPATGDAGTDAPDAPLATGCEAGERPLGDGQCVAAGVPPDACGEGFAAGGDGGCVPVLPAEPCAAGKMAIPGETACRQVAPCAGGRWGAIPVEADTQFVDAGYTGTDSDGTAVRPWTALQVAVDGAAPGAVVAIAAGSYDAVVVAGHPVRLWGTCPELVRVAGTPAAVVVGPGADGTEIRDLAVFGPAIGIRLSGAMDVVADRVWVHDTATVGVLEADTDGPASLVLSRSLVEGAGDAGVGAIGCAMAVERSVVREAHAGSNGLDGRGVEVDAYVSGPGSLVLRASVIERCHGGGALLSGSTALVEDTVIRDILPDEATGKFGRALVIQDDAGEFTARSSATVRRSVFQRARDNGVFVMGSDVTFEDCVIADTLPDSITMEGGRGLEAQWNAATGERANVTVRSSLVAGNREGGVVVVSADAVLESTFVRDTEPRLSDGLKGIGVSIGYDTAPGGGPPSQGTLRWSVVDHNVVIGISVVGSQATLDSVLVRDTLPFADGSFGDGLLLLGGDVPSAASITGSRIERSARAGIANFAGTVSLGSTTLSCNAIDLDGESTRVPYAYHDLGGNACGCGAPVDCKVLSAHIGAPAQ